MKKQSFQVPDFAWALFLFPKILSTVESPGEHLFHLKQVEQDN